MGLEIVIDAIGKAVGAVFGSHNERLVREYRRKVAAVNVLETEFQRLSDEALAAKTEDLRRRLPLEDLTDMRRSYRKMMDEATDQREVSRLKAEYCGRLNAHLDAILPDAFAAVREAAKRTVWIGYGADPEVAKTIDLLGYTEAPADYHPEIQTLIRKAMRGEASLIDPASQAGKTIDLRGLYGMRPYDVQLVAGMALNEGNISELATGEGKTLVATLAAYLNAVVGPVHIVSVNDYLVRRDCEWNRPIFRRLGLTVGAIQADMDNAQRQVQYACDITYGTNNEFGFDYLRDNMKTSHAEQVQGELAYAIVDECDSVLIDEARTPLIISGPAFDSTDKYVKADAVARQLRPVRDFEIKEKEHQCPMSEDGLRRAEELVGVGSFYVAGNMEWPHLIDQSLRAHNLYRRDKEYVVKGDEVIIVDEFTGRLMPGRQWSDGLHQAVEAKERIRIKEETQTLATITLQNFFRMYTKLSGMTGTAMTEAAEFDKIYRLETVAIPTNRPLSRIEPPDVVYRSENEKFEAIVEEIRAYYERGRPVLVGTTSIEKSERLSHMLERKYGIPHEVLNAKQHAKEAEIVAKAGQRHVDADGKEKGNVTIATNMAGRGTDIKLGPGVVWPNCFGPWDLKKQVIPSDFGNKCCVGCREYDAKTHCAHCFKPKLDPDFPKRGKTECVANPPCGLHVVGTERHEARRIDNQLRGRTGRQGDPGSSRFFLSLEDDLMRIFARDWVKTALEKLGMEEGMALEHRWLSHGIENAQKKVEERNFDIRKHLLEYDEVMDRQRKIFYGRRQHILESSDLSEFAWQLLTDSAESACDSYLTETYSYETAAEWARRTLGVQVEAAQLQGKNLDELIEFLQTQAEQTARDAIEETLGEFIPEELDEAPEPETDAEEEEEDEDEEEVEEEEEQAVKADYRSLVSWAESRFGIHLKEPDLKKLRRDEIQDLLEKAAIELIKAVDFTAVGPFLETDYRLSALANWANKKFDFTLSAADLKGKTRDQTVELILDHLRELYAGKERSYPVESAIEEFLTAQAAASSQNFEGLAAWASYYYMTEVRPDDIRARDPRDVRQRLLEIAREFETSHRLEHAVEEVVRAHLPTVSPEKPESWQALAQAAKERLGVEVTPRQFIAACEEAARPAEAPDAGKPEAEKPQSRDEAVLDLVMTRARGGHRARMTALERFLLVQVHDTSWKDHLLVMDHLKSGVGLRGYAQMNPLIEFKKEGLANFENMLESAREKFTDLFFKARWVRQDALARIWAGQSTEHAVAASVYAAQQQAALDAHQQAQMAQEGEAVKTIVRGKPKVGRNDPCPCGSGKKFKKCCGARG
jgi:preprotein translocase subunit SecA